MDIPETRARKDSVSHDVDVCVYGATPAGCAAAIAAAQEGATVLLIEPGRWVGGILGAGIKPLQDCPMPDSIGGLTRDHVLGLGTSPTEVREGYGRWLADEGVSVLYDRRICKVHKAGARISAIEIGDSAPDKWGVPIAQVRTDDTESVTAKVWVDTSYEGDLMAMAGIPYRVGRESTADWGEEPAGVRVPTNWAPIDPYVVRGDPTSGLLPLVEHDHMLPIGSADDYTQAYNFRFYLTSDPSRRAAIDPPSDYDPLNFELVGRYVEHILATSATSDEEDRRLRAIFPGWMNEGEYNYQRESLITIAPVGSSRRYQDGDWTERRAVWLQHVDYLRGLHHFFSSDPRIPLRIREETTALGFERAMHPETDGWPHQLYVRITRRLCGKETVSYANVTHTTESSQPVGLALYGVDCYPVRRIVSTGPDGRVGVATEGEMFLGGPEGTGVPYPIPYGALVPPAEVCENVIVPVCLSATYVAYASARMEPVFSVLGESAGVAAALCARQGETVQDVDWGRLEQRLLARGQVLGTGVGSDIAQKPLAPWREPL